MDIPQDITTLRYAVTYPGDAEQTVIIPQLRTKTRDGVKLTIIRHLAPLIADQIDAIADEGNRLHTLTVLAGAVIVIRDTGDDTIADGWLSGGWCRDQGMLSTTYVGTSDLPADAVLDLADRLRTNMS